MLLRYHQNHTHQWSFERKGQYWVSTEILCSTNIIISPLQKWLWWYHCTVITSDSDDTVTYHSHFCIYQAAYKRHLYGTSCPLVVKTHGSNTVLILVVTGVDWCTSHHQTLTPWWSILPSEVFYHHFTYELFYLTHFTYELFQITLLKCEVLGAGLRTTEHYHCVGQFPFATSTSEGRIRWSYLLKCNQ